MGLLIHVSQSVILLLPAVFPDFAAATILNQSWIKHLIICVYLIL